MSNLDPAILIVCSVDAEADAVRKATGHHQIVVSGVGRTNAAAATTERLLTAGPFHTVVNAGVAGALPVMTNESQRGCCEQHIGEGGAMRRYAVDVGDVVIAERCVYFEEGIEEPEGFRNTSSMGFPLGSFRGNSIDIDPGLLNDLREVGTIAAIATVATCSGTDARAQEVARRTGAIAEAMEGAAVVHAARRLGIPALEVRAISNTTGDRTRQVWNLPAALARLAEVMPGVMRGIAG